MEALSGVVQTPRDWLQRRRLRPLGGGEGGETRTATVWVTQGSAAEEPPGDTAVFDIQIFNLDAGSYVRITSEKDLAKAEK